MTIGLKSKLLLALGLVGLMGVTPALAHGPRPGPERVVYTAPVVRAAYPYARGVPVRVAHVDHRLLRKGKTLEHRGLALLTRGRALEARGWRWGNFQLIRKGERLQLEGRAMIRDGRELQLRARW